MFTNYKRNGDFENASDSNASENARDIMTQINENEQASRKLFLEGQLQMAAPFPEELKPKDP
jgi:hypothetical protein